MQFESNLGVYLLTNIINGKIYVGKSIDMEERYRDYARAKGNGHVIRAIKKYGWENFTFEILESFDEIDVQELLEIESQYIILLDGTNKFLGYNKCIYASDATGLKRSEEVKKKASEARMGKRTGKDNHFFGKKLSEEHKRKMSETRIREGTSAGEKHPLFGKKHSEEHKRKMSESQKGRPSPRKGIPLSEEHKQKVRDTRICKPVNQIDLVTGEIIKTWESGRAARRVYGSNLNKVLKGEYSQSQGFFWQYAENEVTN